MKISMGRLGPDKSIPEDLLSRPLPAPPPCRFTLCSPTPSKQLPLGHLSGGGVWTRQGPVQALEAGLRDARIWVPRGSLEGGKVTGWRTSLSPYSVGSLEWVKCGDSCLPGCLGLRVTLIENK